MCCAAGSHRARTATADPVNEKREKAEYVVDRCVTMLLDADETKTPQA